MLVYELYSHLANFQVILISILIEIASLFQQHLKQGLAQDSIGFNPT